MTVSRYAVEGLSEKLPEADRWKIEIIPYESEGWRDDKYVHQVGLRGKSNYPLADKLPLFADYAKLLLQGSKIEYSEPGTNLRLMLNVRDFKEEGFLEAVFSSAEEIIKVQDQLDVAYGKWENILSEIYPEVKF